MDRHLSFSWFTVCKLSTSSTLGIAQPMLTIIFISTRVFHSAPNYLAMLFARTPPPFILFRSLLHQNIRNVAHFLQRVNSIRFICSLIYITSANIFDRLNVNGHSKWMTKCKNLSWIFHYIAEFEIFPFSSFMCLCHSMETEMGKIFKYFSSHSGVPDGTP